MLTDTSTRIEIAADVHIDRDASIVTFTLLTDAARAWVDENVPLLKDAIDALLPFAEPPSTAMDHYPCHYGLGPYTNCGRCRRAVSAYRVIERARAVGLVVA